MQELNDERGNAVPVVAADQGNVAVQESTGELGSISPAVMGGAHLRAGLVAFILRTGL